MRLLERTLKNIEIAPRRVEIGGLGGAAEGFSEERMRVRGSVIPSTGKLVSREMGVLQTRSMCLLMPPDAKISVGDGVGVDGGKVEWRCVNVERWSAHVAAQVERI